MTIREHQSSAAKPSNLKRRDLLRLGTAAALGAAGYFTASPAEAAYRADSRIIDLFGKVGNWQPYNSQSSYFVWKYGGAALDTFIKSIQPSGAYYRSAREYAISGKLSGVNVPDGECVALVRAATPNWGSGYRYSTANWRPGINALYPPSGKIVTTGTIIARFSNGRYVGGHTAIFAGYRSASAGGGFGVWQQNVQGTFITWQSYLPGGTGYKNPAEYYVVELAS